MAKKLVNLLLVVLLVCAGTHSLFAGDGNNKDRALPVMTRNTDAGSDFGFVLAAAQNPNATQTDLLVAITNTFAEMHLSNYAARADGIAAEIQATQPYLIGLQEVTTLRIDPFPGHATTVVDDALQSLLASLKRRGLQYAPIKIQTNADVEFPALDQSFNLMSVGFTDYDVVLARTDLPVSQLKVEDIQAQHFETILAFPIGLQTVQFVRGWIAVDAKLRGKQYRFVTTHLETFENQAQAAQAEELLRGPLNTDLPVILAGDLNSDAHVPSFEHGPAYGIFLSAGFTDVWSEIHPGEPGLTWPLFAEDPFGPATPLQRIDLILVKGEGIDASAIALTGTTPINGLFSSDHAGVVASFKLLP